MEKKLADQRFNGKIEKRRKIIEDLEARNEMRKDSGKRFSWTKDMQENLKVNQNGLN